MRSVIRELLDYIRFGKTGARFFNHTPASPIQLRFPYTACVTLVEILELLTLGLVTGIVGGLLGIGGSIIVIPLLTLLLHLNQHLSQAVAMIINIFVALPALLQHHRAGAVRWDIMRIMLPLGLVFIIVGVELSNRVDSVLLKRAFGVFLIYMIVINVHQLMKGKPEPKSSDERTSKPRIAGIGAVTGIMAGLLGIGGGNIAIPLLQRFVRLPLRQCIATTAAFMCFSATLGAIFKNIALDRLTDPAGVSLNLSWAQSLPIAAVLAPTAIIGGLIGARLTHALPLKWVRLAFIVLLAWACLDMLDVV